MTGIVPPGSRSLLSAVAGARIIVSVDSAEFCSTWWETSPQSTIYPVLVATVGDSVSSALVPNLKIGDDHFDLSSLKVLQFNEKVLPSAKSQPMYIFQS